MLIKWCIFIVLTAQVLQGSIINTGYTRRKFDRWMSKLDIKNDYDRKYLVTVVQLFDRDIASFQSDTLFSSKSYPKVERIRKFISLIDQIYDEFINKINDFYISHIKISEKQLNQTIADMKKSKYFWPYGHLVRSYPSFIDILEGVIERTYKYTYSNIIPHIKKSWCNSASTYEQQLIFQIHNIIEMGDLKKYVMAIFVDKLHKNNFYAKKELLLKELKTKVHKLMKQKESEFNIPVRRCDPVKFTKDKNFLQFTKLIQGFIPKLDGYHSLTDWETQCHGRQMDCMAITTSGKVCLSSFPSRRFDYVQMKNGSSLGKFQYCKTANIRNWNDKQFCLCDEEVPTSDRFISLKQVVSNVKENMVVTGLKFVKNNRIIHLQIQQGKLLPYGMINQSTVKWVPPDNFSITTEGIMNTEDYFLLTNMSRTMAIDEIETRMDNYIVTGIGFKVIDSKLQLIATYIKFDPKTGLIDIERNITLNNKNVNRKYILLIYPDIPTYTDKPSELISFQPAYINFTNTDPSKDAAQTTVPFFDAQEVTTEPAAPLIGAGLFYKGKKGFGGFIAPMIRTYRYMKNIL